MSDSDADYRRAVEIFDRVAALLDEERLIRQIDEPIDEAVRTFQCPDTRRMSNRQFLDILADFLRRLHAKAFPNGRQLSMSTARDEAIAMLGPSSLSTGYCAAFLEARELGGEALADILTTIADQIKMQKRHLYWRWVEVTQIGFQDWHLKRRMAEILLQRFRRHISPDQPDCAPAQMTGHVLHLLLTSIAGGEYHPQTRGSPCSLD